jgi:hypothetical protein
MNKYRNQKIEVQGVLFDSKAEAEYYQRLLTMQAQGIVKAVELQPVVELQPRFQHDGRTIRAITYAPDFKVEYTDGRVAYVDIKGMSTQQGELKRKLWWYRFPDIPLLWIAKSKKWSKTGWIMWDELQSLRRANKREKEKKLAQNRI